MVRQVVVAFRDEIEKIAVLRPGALQRVVLPQAPALRGAIRAGAPKIAPDVPNLGWLEENMPRSAALLKRQQATPWHEWAPAGRA